MKFNFLNFFKSMGSPGQSAPEFALVAALIVLAAGSSIGPVKEAIENQGKLSAQSISSDGLEVSGSECLRVGGGRNGNSGNQCFGNDRRNQNNPE